MKKSIFLAMTALLALSFVGCKDKDNNPAPADSSSSVESSVEVSSSEEVSSEVVSSEVVSSEVVSSEEVSSEEVSSEEVSSEEVSSEEVSSEEASSEEASSEEVSSEEASSEESSEEEVVDETAPAFSELDLTQFEGFKVGDTITIPGITATDDVDGEVPVTVLFGNPRMPMPSVIGAVHTFDFAGTYVIQYQAQDAAGNYNSVTYYITVEEEPTVAKALEDANMYGYQVTNGTLTLTSGGYVIDDVAYELASNYFHYVKAGEDWEGNPTTQDNWIMAYDGGMLWLVDDNDGYGAYKANYETLAGMENGFAFEMVFDYTNTYYGVEEFVTAIYGLSEEKVETVEDGVYSFSLVYVNEYDTKYEVSVSFTLSEMKIMNSVNIEIAQFYYGEISVPVVDENNEPVLDADGNPTYETAMGYAEEANTVKVYAITQSTDGEVAPAYDPEELLVSSYTLKDEAGEEVSALDLVAGEQVTLTVADVPETCVAKYDTFNVTVVDEYGVEVDSSVLNVYVSTYYDPVIYVTGYAAGEYTVTITSAFVTKTFTASVTLPETTELKVYANWQYVTEAEIYLDSAFDFEVKANENADASAMVEVTNYPDGAYYEVAENGDNEYSFSTDTAGEYEITITSIANEDVYMTLTITVKEVPEIDTILNGQWQNVGKDKDNNLMLMMDYENGELVVTYDGVVFDYSTWTESEVKWAYIYLYTYDPETKDISLILPAEMDESFTDEMLAALLEEMGITGYTLNADVLNSLTLNADYTVSAVYAEQGQQAKLEAWAELVVNPYEDVAGEYRYIFGTWGEEDYGRWVFVLGDDGTGAFYNQMYNSAMGWMTGDQIAEFNYTIAEDGSLEITEITYGEVAGFDLETVNSTIVYDENMTFGGEYGYQCPGISFTFNGETTAFEKN